jgi:predicted phosphoribosyltransferase
MTLPFFNRPDAGRQLADELRDLAGRSNLLVLGLPRGGVPVAAEVAEALGSPLDVFVVRKLGVPGHEEFAMGAVASGGVRVLNQETVQALRIPRHVFDAVSAREQRELERREREYRLGRPFPDLRGKTVILVDDGVATGSTMLAAVYALREHHPAAIIAAAPVMSREAMHELMRAADRCESVVVPEPFLAVARWYRDFEQTTDQEVRALLRRASTVSTAEGAGQAPHATGRYAARG